MLLADHAAITNLIDVLELLPEHSDNQVLLMCDLMAPASYTTSLPYPCDMAYLSGQVFQTRAVPGKSEAQCKSKSGPTCEK